MNNRLIGFFGKLRRALLSNLIWKILSLVCAFILWSYVVNSDTRNILPRWVTFRAADVGVVGTKDIANWNLALLSDPSAIMDEVRVRVDVSRTYFSRVSTDNVQVELDLSRVRQKGVHEVRLTATSTYGRVYEIIPATVTITVEEMDSRNVPINVVYIGRSEGYSYTTRSTNPTSIRVSGPSSIVRQVKQANVEFDATDDIAPVSQTELVILVDAEGNEITHPQMVKAPSSVIVNADIYPERALIVDTDSAVFGTPADGYHVDSVVIRPDFILVSGDEALLSRLDKLFVAPIDVNENSEMQPVQARIKMLPGLFYQSADVLVEIHIIKDTE